jgi:choline dehydrogenase-like flavoprotein
MSDSPWGEGVPGWSKSQLRGLAAVFATFSADAYEGESQRHASLAAEALNDVAEPADLRQLKLILTLLEAPVGVSSLTGTQAFSRLSRDARERLLHGWSKSRLAQRRTFFQTIKRLASFFAYADPGPGGVNPRWQEMGYALPGQPAPPLSAVDGAIVRPTDAAGLLELSADVVVVGSGAGGGVVAARLAEAGLGVLVIEAGPYVPETAMPTDELAAFDRLYLDHGMTSTTDLGVAILAGAAVGGGTLINWTTCIEPPAWIRAEWATDHGLTDFDGPSTDTQLARLRDELGFLPPTTIGPKDQVILDGAAALDWEAATTERNAMGCGDCGACTFGCRRGTKLSGLRVHLAAAAERGARILPDARVERVGRDGTVRGRLAGGRQFTVRAVRVVLAAGPLRTPLILLRSGIDHAEIGRNLHLHPTAAIGARFPARVEMWRDTMQAARSMEHIRAGVLVESAPAHPGLIAQAFPWQSAATARELMKEIGHYGPLIGIVRDRDGGRVTLSRSGRARIHYRISERDARTARLGLVSMARLARAAGATRLLALGTPAAWHDVDPNDGRAFDAYLDSLGRFDFTPNRGSLFSAHQMGTVRAGADARRHPCDPWGRVRGARNLYVADASLFPTALGVNPMITVMALAARVAETVKQDVAH